MNRGLKLTLLIGIPMIIGYAIAEMRPCSVVTSNDKNRSEIESVIGCQLPADAVVEGFHMEEFQDQLAYLRLKLPRHKAKQLAQAMGFVNFSSSQRFCKNNMFMDESKIFSWWRPDEISKIISSEIPIHSIPVTDQVDGQLELSGRSEG